MYWRKEIRHCGTQGDNYETRLLGFWHHVLPAESQWWRRLVRILSNARGCLPRYRAPPRWKKANFLCHFSRVIIRKIYSWNIPGVFVLTPLEFKFVNTFQKTHSVSQYKVQVNILTNACTKWNTINRKKNHKIQFMVSTFRCFGTGVLSSGSLLKQRNTSTDRHDVIMKILKYWNSRIHMVRQV